MTPTDGTFEPRIVMQDLTDAMVCYESVRAMREALKRAAITNERNGDVEEAKSNRVCAKRMNETLHLLQTEVARLRLLNHPEHRKACPN